jgi:hypothetical protein
MSERLTYSRLKVDSGASKPDGTQHKLLDVS